MKKLTLYSYVLLFVSILLGLAMAEIALRQLGYTAWKPLTAFDAAPIVTLPEQDLGWANKPGRYAYSVTGDGQNQVTITINPAGTRGHYSTATDKPKIWLMGCSFTEGWAVTDGEEYPAVLSDQLKPYTIANYGVPGYGTVQSMLLYQKQSNHSPRPETVVYGFFEDHAQRNVATNYWVHILDRAASHQAWVKTPYVRLDGDKLRFYPPRGYQRWPLSDRLATVNLLEERFNQLRDRALTHSMHEITVQTIKHWKQMVERRGSKFVVAMLHAPSHQAFYARRFAEEKIDFVDISHTPYPAPEASVPVDGHPNATVHAIWGNALARYFK